MPTRRTFLLAGATLAAGGAAGAFALRPAPLPPAQVFAVDGVALRGTDPVAYFTEGMPVPGDPAATLDWAGATWRFATIENRDRFRADPDAYAPAYGGFCAWAVAAKRQLFSTRPRNWAVVGRRLFLNYDDAVQETWDRDRARFIAEADRAWPEVVAGAAPI